MHLEKQKEPISLDSYNRWTVIEHYVKKQLKTVPERRNNS